MGILINASLALLAYTFPADRPLDYAVSLQLNGYLPVFGGSDGKVQADLVMGVQGMTPDPDANARLFYELKNLKVMFNDVDFPLQLDSAKTYFPKTTISVSPQGKVLKTNAPSIQLPVRLPGLDVKRFPEITFLGVELPATPVAVGQSWTAVKDFGDSKVTEVLTPTSVTPDKIELSIAIDQSLDTMEDAGHGLAQTPADAVTKVHTVMHGTGKAVFDPTRGVLISSTIDTDAVGTVTDLTTKAVTTRNLHTKLVVGLAENQPTSAPASPAAKPNPPASADDLKAMLKFYWQIALLKATPIVEELKQYVRTQIAYVQQQLIK